MIVKLFCKREDCLCWVFIVSWYDCMGRNCFSVYDGFYL